MLEKIVVPQGQDLYRIFELVLATIYHPFVARSLPGDLYIVEFAVLGCLGDGFDKLPIAP